MTRLTVIVPCYNVATFAAQTLRSLRRSAGPGIEFVLVDDGSTDATPAVLRREATSLPGASVLETGANGGVGAARNLGLRSASGTYLTFLDGDDFVTAGYYPALLAVIERLGCDMVRTDHVQVRGRQRSVHRIGYGPRGVVRSPRSGILPLTRATSVDAPNAWAGIYHRRLLDAGLLEFDETLRTCEDRLWNWRLHLEVSTFAVSGLLGVHYRRNVATSLTQLADERQLDFIPAFDRIVALVEQDRDAATLLPKAVRSYCAVVLHHLGQADRYQPETADQLNRLSRAALERLPTAVLAEVRGSLSPARDARLEELLAA